LRSIRFAVFAAISLVAGFVVVGAPVAWANQGFHGDSTCPHDNGTYNSSACYYGVVQYWVAANTSLPSPPAYLGGYINHVGDQLRQRVTIFGGKPGQLAETGFDTYYPAGCYPPNCGAVDEPYIDWIDQNGGQTFETGGNLDSCVIDSWTLRVTYGAVNNPPNNLWYFSAYDNTRPSCGIQDNTPSDIGIYGGAVTEAGSVWCVCNGGGYFGDGSYMYTWNVLSATIGLNNFTTRSWSTYDTDAACPGAPCMNGNWFNGTYVGWSSNSN
jgi:hypothetical protein